MLELAAVKCYALVWWFKCFIDCFRAEILQISEGVSLEGLSRWAQRCD